MKEYFVDLTDGTRLEIKVNFGTIYYLQKTKGFYRLIKKAKRAEKKEAKNKENPLSEMECMELAADLIYAVLRSNGRAVSFDEALSLVPPDTDSVKEMLEGFQARYDEYIKKKRAKTVTIPEC